MTDKHPNTPPPELVEQWIAEGRHQDYCAVTEYVAHHAAEWGADQELEACCEWFVKDWTDIETADKLRAARRPKPPSLKEQALETLKYPRDLWSQSEVDTIRRALEALPDD
jgi:hypothetical protein